jgi:hypothetical protein
MAAISPSLSGVYEGEDMTRTTASARVDGARAAAG